MKKVIVTGGLGYIGSHTAISLIEQGFEVIIVDNLTNSTEDTLRRINSISGRLPTYFSLDMCDPSTMDNILTANSDTDAIIHFAALKAVKESVDQPMAYYRNNLLSLINLLQAMDKHQIRNLVFSSSATVYGRPNQLPLTENDPTKPALSPYGNTKKIGEDIIRDVTRANSKFNAITLRYFNPIGAHESGYIGELPIGIPNNLMPFITQTAIGLRSELVVFGNDYNTPDGTAIRDYIHVVDLAHAHTKTVHRLLKKKQNTRFETFNIGTGKGSSVLEVIRSFEKVSGKKLNYSFKKRRPGDVEAMYASTELANRKLEWTAKFSLDQMTASAWKWECHLQNEKKNHVDQ